MATDEGTPRSRRAILSAAAGAAGAAGALAVGALIPASVAAASTTLMSETDNPTSADTSVTNSAATGAALIGKASAVGSAYGLFGKTAGDGTNANPGAAGVVGFSTGEPVWSPTPFAPSDTVLTGVFGYAPAGDHVNNAGSGVWGDSPDTGVYGSGGTGVEGHGYWGVLGHANKFAGSIGVYAYAADTTSTALYVDGKAHFTRSGRAPILAGKASVKVLLPGATGSTKVFGVLATSASGRYIRAIVPTTGAFTIYLNTTLTAKAYVSWFALD